LKKGVSFNANDKKERSGKDSPYGDTFEKGEDGLQRRRRLVLMGRDNGKIGPIKWRKAT